jgi:hypothetical protein
MGVYANGRSELLGFKKGNSESKFFWTEFLASLQEPLGTSCRSHADPMCTRLQRAGTARGHDRRPGQCDTPRVQIPQARNTIMIR